jgi:hypothetical protein
MNLWSQSLGSCINEDRDSALLADFGDWLESEISLVFSAGKNVNHRRSGAQAVSQLGQVRDLDDYKAMNEVFIGRFGPEPPVRTTVACAGGIPGNSLVEMDVIAYL